MTSVPDCGVDAVTVTAPSRTSTPTLGGTTLMSLRRRAGSVPSAVAAPGRTRATADALPATLRFAPASGVLYHRSGRRPVSAAANENQVRGVPEREKIMWTKVASIGTSVLVSLGLAGFLAARAGMMRA